MPNNKARMLRIEPVTEDENLLAQLIASAKRIEVGMTDIAFGMNAVLDGRARPARLNVSGPEPEWLADVRERHNNARSIQASVVVIPRTHVARILELIDAARRG
jgi:hypothetical protein